MKCKVPGWFTDVGLFLIRAMLATVFMFHGSQKLFGWFGGYGFEATVKAFGGMGMPYPAISVGLAGSAEFFGGLCLLLGLCPRLAAIPMAFTMGVAVATVHLHNGFSGQGGMEFPLTLGVVLLALVFTGGGRIAVWPCSRCAGKSE